MITNLSVGRYGRFANMLFQIAAVVGIARKSNQSYGFPPLFNYDHRERFGSTEDIDIEKHFAQPFPRLDRPPSAFIERPYAFGYHDIYLPSGDWALSGHFQSERYFAHCITEVRQLLTMKDEPAMMPEVAVHVRRGDYDNVYHTHIGADYYAQAIARFPDNTRFLVFSDDIEAAMGIFRSFGKVPSPEFNFVVNQSYLDDFRMMKRCSHFITANSSFSLMAAILSDAPGKQIICPRNWFGPAWKPDTSAIYPLNSIKL